VKFSNTFFVVFFFFSSAAHAQPTLNLESFLQRVQERHHGLQALSVSKEAAEDRRVSGDVPLLPTLTLKGSHTDDKKQPNLLGASSTVTDVYSLTLAKKLPTGTQLAVSSTLTGVTNNDLSIPAYSSLAKYAQGSLGVSISQSLWRDFFGQATRMRRRREAYAAQMERSGYSLQERKLLVDAEAAYWDNLYLKEELRLREASLKRAAAIEKWTHKRLNNGIGDKADALNAQALVASRELELLNTQDDWTANQKKIRDLLELNEGETLPVLQGKIDRSRGIADRFRGQKRVVLLEAYLAEMEAATKNAAAEEVKEGFRPDLNLTGAYNTNSYAAGGAASNASSGLTDNNFPTSYVAVSFTYLFDTSVKDAARGSAKKDAIAAELRSERKKRESDLAWNELLRRNGELGKKVDAARIISNLQSNRAKTEQDKLAKGRSITTNVIQSEQDAAEAELRLAKLMVEQRKMEAQAQLFIGMEGAQ
jgi:outer membrane protein TolC